MRTLDTRKNSMRLAVSKWWEHPKLNTRWVGGRTAQAPLDLARAAVGRAVVAVVAFAGEGAAEAEHLEEAGGIGPCGVDVAIGGRAGIRNRQPGHGLHRGAGADERRVDLDEAVAGAIVHPEVVKAEVVQRGHGRPGVELQAAGLPGAAQVIVIGALGVDRTAGVDRDLVAATAASGDLGAPVGGGAGGGVTLELHGRAGADREGVRILHE